MIRTIASVLFLLVTLTAPALADASSHTILGHSVEVVRDRHHYGFVLKVDGKIVHRNGYISVDDLATVHGTKVAIGSSSNGGNACDTAPFVLSFPVRGKPRIDGPLNSCKSVSYKIKHDRIRFESAAFEGDDGQAWIWTPAHGFKSAGRIEHRADPTKGWRDLTANREMHPTELLDLGEIAPKLLALLGADRRNVLPLINGTGSGKFVGDLYVGTTCRPHACPDAGVLIVANPQTKELYVAWKLEHRKIERRSTARHWSRKAEAQYDDWAKQWR